MQDLQNYLLKKKQADQYRANQAQNQAMVQGANSDALYTPGFENAPPRVDVNWGSAIEKLGGGALGAYSGYKAGQAEDEAATARKTALEAMMGDKSPMTPERVEQLSQLGLSPEAMQMLVPEKDALGAVAQAASTPQGRAVLVMQGKMTQEQADALSAQESASAAAAAQAEKDQFLWEQQNTYRAPTKERAETELEFAQRDPEGYAKYVASKNAGDAPELSPYEKKFEQERAAADVKLLDGESRIDLNLEAVRRLKDQNQSEPSTIPGTSVPLGPVLRFGDTITEMMPGSPKISNALPSTNVQVQDANNLRLAAMEQMRGFGQVTEAEQKIIEGTQFDVYDTPAVRAKKLGVIEQQLQSGRAKVAEARKRSETGRAVLPSGVNLGSGGPTPTDPNAGWGIVE